jgi:glycosyltransferase involved in cell wall biosynthesis
MALFSENRSGIQCGIRKNGNTMEENSGNTPISAQMAAYNEKQAPLVSVIIPFYKQERYIEETIRSVEEQTYPNIETIVVDDGSPMSAESVLGNRQKVVILRTDNRGCTAARNYGFKRSSGKYLIFLDSDDRLVPGAIEAHLEAFAAHPTAGLCFGAARIIDDMGRELKRAHICRPRKNYFAALLEGNPIACPGAAMMPRNAFIEVGLWDESIRKAEDYLLYLRLARHREVTQHKVCVVDHRLHKESASQDKEEMLVATMTALDRLERDCLLSSFERHRLSHGRRRWAHDFRPRNTLLYKIRNLYYRCHSICDVPLRSYLTTTR